MGKIRVKTLGIDELEEKEAKEAKTRQDEKKIAAKKEREDSPIDELSPTQDELEMASETEEDKPKKKDKFKKDKKESRSKRYQTIAEVGTDRKNEVTIAQGLEILSKMQRGSFDETVELHINTLTPGISGNVTLPHGTGKKTRVVIADDNVIAGVEKGVINFDILVATPSMMPKLAKVARVLGPRGLMPNPKTGTITEKPEELVKKYEGGQTSFKTEAKSPIIHTSVGKVSFGTEKLTQNIEALIAAVKKSNIVNTTLKSTMSPGIKIKV